MLVRYPELEKATWSAETGPTINDPVANEYRIVQANGALSLVMCSCLPYSGWLAKQVAPLLLPATRIKFRYTMMTDDATDECAQVAETDTKLTDAEGWTYDLSAQWEMQKVAPDWMFQIDNENWTWEDAGIIVPPSLPYVPRSYLVDSIIDYQNKQSAIVAVEVDGYRFELPVKGYIPARQEGWAPKEIVTQLQQCVGAQGGGYTLRFTAVGYDLQGELNATANRAF